MEKNELIAGVDEVGRGCLAGDVVAAAVILDPSRPIAGLKDSKKLTAEQREQLFYIIQEKAITWAVGVASVQEIYHLNILHASLLAMRRAVGQLTLTPTLALIDGNHCATPLPCKARAIIKGDSQVPAIAAASIIAKVWRDSIMTELGKLYPLYTFECHKGYGTPAHKQALKLHGITPFHRLGFAPVKEALQLSLQ